MENMAVKKQKSKIPAQARVVVIGGGIVGCSTAYHLSKLGWKDIVLLERAQLTAGTTWHAAGLIEAGGFFDATSVEMTRYSLELYSALEKETGQATGYKKVGMITLAHRRSPGRITSCGCVRSQVWRSDGRTLTEKS